MWKCSDAIRPPFSQCVSACSACVHTSPMERQMSTQRSLDMHKPFSAHSCIASERGYEIGAFQKEFYRIMVTPLGAVQKTVYCSTISRRHRLVESFPSVDLQGDMHLWWRLIWLDATLFSVDESWSWWPSSCMLHSVWLKYLTATEQQTFS